MWRISLIGLCGALCFTAGMARATGPGAAVASRGEEWLGEGSDLKLELAHVVAAGKKGNPAQALRALELIAAEAESRGLKAVWLEAHQAWVRFSMAAEPELDLTPAVEQLLAKARQWAMAGEEAEVFALWAAVAKSQGQWLMALKAQDRVSQLALEAGRVARSVEAFLEMARLCREAGHPWRLRQVWVRIDQVLATRPINLPEGLQEALARGREEDTTVLSQSPGAAGTGVDLQPRDSRVLVSAPDRELGRSRFLLTNTTAFPAEGRLVVTAGQTTVSGWQTGESAWYVTMAKGGQADSARSLRLRPGQQLEVYLEHAPGSVEDKVQVRWEGQGTSVAATGTFYSGNGLPAASVVNAGVFQLNAGWSIPLYHEIYHRGPRARVQNLAVRASAACRLEIFDHDTGRLLAVDADGDGFYFSPGDRVLEDADRDGWPDLVIGDRARALEICVWPLGVTGAGITVQAGLRGVDGATGGVENRVQAAVPVRP